MYGKLVSPGDVHVIVELVTKNKDISTGFKVDTSLVGKGCELLPITTCVLSVTIGLIVSEVIKYEEYEGQFELNMDEVIGDLEIQMTVEGVEKLLLDDDVDEIGNSDTIAISIEDDIISSNEESIKLPSPDPNGALSCP